MYIRIYVRYAWITATVAHAICNFLEVFLPSRRYIHCEILQLFCSMHSEPAVRSISCKFHPTPFISLSVITALQRNGVKSCMVDRPLLA